MRRLLEATGEPIGQRLNDRHSEQQQQQQQQQPRQAKLLTQVDMAVRMRVQLVCCATDGWRMKGGSWAKGRTVSTHRKRRSRRTQTAVRCTCRVCGPDGAVPTGRSRRHNDDVGTFDCCIRRSASGQLTDRRAQQVRGSVMQMTSPPVRLRCCHGHDFAAALCFVAVIASRRRFVDSTGSCRL
jgi:hypothetical protein